jgi:uncharacterized membrane protein YhaH (DUF805 family)
MQALRFLLSPLGRLAPRPFVFGAISIYLAGAASQLLTAPDIIIRAGLWPFAVAQTVLIWLWYALHAKRLRDAGRSSGIAAAGALLYAFSVVLLLIVTLTFFTTVGNGVPDANSASALGLILLISIIVSLAGASSHDLGWVVVVVLVVLAYLPIVVALEVTIWAATRPSRKPEEA